MGQALCGNTPTKNSTTAISTRKKTIRAKSFQDMKRIKTQKVTVSQSNVYDFYVVEKELGQGAFGQVRMASSKANPSKKFAIKSIDYQIMKGHEHLLTNEINIMKHIDHPNIVHFYEAYQDGKYIYLVQEYCPGGDMTTNQKNQPHKVFSEKIAANLILQLLQALEYMHCSNIVHRDLKLDNLMLGDSTQYFPYGMIKIIDFGLAKNVKDFLTTNEQSQAKVQQMFSVVGTPVFMAPEVVKGKYDYKCDYWSVGVILFFMLSGNYPYRATSTMDISQLVKVQKIDMKNEKWVNISKEAKDFVRSLLQINPAKRSDFQRCVNHPWLKGEFLTQQNYIRENISKIDPAVLTRLTNFQRMTSFSREIMKVAMVNFTEQQEMTQLNQAFLLIDQDNNGFITLQELTEVLRNADQQNRRESMDVFSSMVEQKSETRIEYQAFLIAAVDKTFMKTEQRLKCLFDYFDTDRSGYLTILNIVEIFARGGTSIEVSDVKKMLKDFDLSFDGRIDYSEFKQMFLYDLEDDENKRMERKLSLPDTHRQVE